MTTQEHDKMNQHKKYIEAEKERLHPEEKRFSVRVRDNKGNRTNWLDINETTMHKVFKVIADDRSTLEEPPTF